MDYIQSSNKQVDKFGAGAHGFSPGNPGGGVPATFLSPEFCDDVMMEIVNVVKAGALVPAAGARSQMLSALKAGGLFGAVAVVTATGSLTAAHVGNAVAVNAAGATVQTLPPASSVLPGAEIEVFNINTGTATVQRAGADVLRTGSGTVTSLACGPGDTLRLRGDGVSTWQAVGGSVQLGASAAFGASRAGNGHQRLPGGLILQWGTGNTGGGTSVTVTFPTAFPTAVPFAVVTANITSSVAGNVICATAPTTTQFTASSNVSSFSFSWWAVGN